MNNTETLVTGATGFIGRNLTKKLAEKHMVRCLVRETSDKSRVYELKNHAHIYYGDVRDKESLRRAAAGIDSVIHLVGVMAGTTGEKVSYEQVHVGGTKNLVDACKEADIKKFIYVSALGASPDAATPFWRTKYEAEQIVVNSSLVYTIFRPSFVHGVGDYLVNQMYVRWIKNLHVAPVLRPSGKSQPVWVDDLIECLVKSLGSEKIKGVYEIGGPDQLTLDEFVNSIRDVLNIRSVKLPLPSFLVRFTRIWPLSKVYPKVFSSYPITAEQVTMLQSDNICDVEKVKRDFSIDLMPFKEALRTYLERK